MICLWVKGGTRHEPGTFGPAAPDHRRRARHPCGGRHRAAEPVHHPPRVLLLLNLSLFAQDINQAGPDRLDENTVFTVLQYIEAHYRDGTLADAAALVHRPAYAVSRLLTRHTGQNFRQLLQQRKLQQAAYLLGHTPLPVESILENIGYENSSYFYRRFRARYGCSPAEYRASRSV